MQKDLILLVDDDSDSESLLRQAFELEAPEIQLDWVQNGRVAIDYLQAKPPHQNRIFPTLLLLDLRMPVINGFDTLEWLQRCPQFRPQYLVVFTTSDDPNDCLRAHQLGADGLIVKPGGFSKLREEVRILAHYARTGFWTGDKIPDPDYWFHGTFPRH